MDATVNDSVWSISLAIQGPDEHLVRERTEDLSHDRIAEALLGGWLLHSFVSRDADAGAQWSPYGEHSTGLILYTADGYMSAQLTPGPGAEFVASGGRFHVNEESRRCATTSRYQL